MAVPAATGCRTGPDLREQPNAGAGWPGGQLTAPVAPGHGARWAGARPQRKLERDLVRARMRQQFHAIAACLFGTVQRGVGRA